MTISVHIDLKSDLNEEEIIEQTNDKITVVKRYKVDWSRFNQIKSILQIIESAAQKDKCEFSKLLSGQDLPIKSYQLLNTFVGQNKNNSFITSLKLPFGGWNYNIVFGHVQWFWFMDLTRFKDIFMLHILSYYIFNLFNIARPKTINIEFFGGSDWWMPLGEIAHYNLSEFNLNTQLRGYI